MVSVAVSVVVAKSTLGVRGSSTPSVDSVVEALSTLGVGSVEVVVAMSVEEAIWYNESVLGLG